MFLSSACCVMPGVTRQAIGIHSGQDVTFPRSRSIDRRDYHNPTPCEEPHFFFCTQVVHFTENESAASIGGLDDEIEPFHFKAKPWWIDRTEQDRITSLKLSWWSPFPQYSWYEQANDNLPYTNIYHAWSELADIGNSAALNGSSFCGPIGFVIGWKDILHQYVRNRGKTIDDVELRTLGTFRYKAEIMYAVLVCVTGDVGVERYPIIDAEGTEAFKNETGHDYFTWKVYSTVGFSSCRNMNVEWTWDHICFGFYCPTSDLIIEPQLCSITEKESTTHKPSSRSHRYERRRPEDMVASAEVMLSLRRKIGR